MTVVREGLLAALMSRRGREMQLPSLGGQKATQAGLPCRWQRLGLRALVLDPMSQMCLQRPNGGALTCWGGLAGRLSAPWGLQYRPVSPSIAQYLRRG